MRAPEASVDTCSTLGRVAACPASTCLPRVETYSAEARFGNAMHDHMMERARLGVDAALAAERIAAIAKKWHLDDRYTGLLTWKAKAFEWCPPTGSFAEVALALREDGRVERVRLREDVHKYEELDGSPLRADTVVAGTLDVMWSEPEPLDLSDPEHPRCPPGSVLWCPDYKNGSDANVTPIEANAQAAAIAVLAARWTGAREVVPGILFLAPPHGDWDTPEAIWGMREIAAAEARVRAIVAQRRAVQAAHADGRALTYNEGPWCTFCPGQTYCPAKVAMMKRVAATGEPLVEGAPLTEDERRFWATNLTAIRAIVENADAALKADVEARGPVDLGGGLMWGPVEAPKRSIEPKRALPVLQEELGEFAVAALHVSKTGIEEAARAKLAHDGVARKLGPTVRKIMAKLQDAEAIAQEPDVKFTKYRADAALPPPRANDDDAAA